MLLGSFDILMTQTARRTNDVIKVLAIASLGILPSSLIAAILGMSFHPAFFNTPGLFWVALGFMAALIIFTLSAARQRHWI
jgi:Mg2+ and Co2+ transporter CorA